MIADKPGLHTGDGPRLVEEARGRRPQRVPRAEPGVDEQRQVV